MAVQAFLRRLVVIRHDGQDGIGTNLFGVFRQFDGFRGRIGTRAGNDRDTLGGLFDHDLDQLVVFLHIDRRRLAGRPDDDDRIGSFLDVVVDQPTHAGQIQTAVLVHRRDDRNKGSRNHIHGKLPKGEWIILTEGSPPRHG